MARVCRVCMHCRGRKDLCSHGTPVWLSSLPPLRSYLPATGMAMTRMAVQCRIQIPFIPEKKKARDFPLAVSRAKGSVLAHPQNLPRATRMHFAVHRSTDKLLLQMQELARPLWLTSSGINSCEITRRKFRPSGSSQLALCLINLCTCPCSTRGLSMRLRRRS